MAKPPPNNVNQDEEPIPLWFRLGIAMTSLLITGLLGEGLTRWLDGGARPHLNIFLQTDDNPITLAPNSVSQVRRITGEIFRVTTDPSGLREPTPSENGWLVVGDSQVLGMGVSDRETFSALAGLYNAGVPGYGVLDALESAAKLVPDLDVSGVIVMVNQANDWAEGLTTINERYAVAQGWLLQSNNGAAAGFWASPLSRSHLFYYAGLLLTVGGPQAFSAADGTPPPWLHDPRSQESLTAAFGKQIRAFAEARPNLPIVVGFLPVDLVAGPDRIPQSAFGQYADGMDTAPWLDSELRDQLQAATTPLPFLDLTPVFENKPDSFLERDYHLSPKGHARVAAAISENIL